MSKLPPPDILSLSADVKRLEAELSMAKQLTNRYESCNRLCVDLMNERSQFAGQLYAHGLRLDPDGNIYPIWMPTDDVVIRFDDKTGEERTPQQLGEMANAMRAIANMYDYDLKQWGSGEAFLKFAELQIEMNKKWEQHGQI